MGKYSSARRGKYKPKNPHKWMTPNKIIYRSSIEKRYFILFDLSSSVTNIASEKVIIPYFDRVSNKQRKYYIDLIVKYKDKDDNISVKLIEVKSFTESIEPRKPKRITENYKSAVATYITNQCKWKAARHYANKRGWEFVVLTERDLKR